MDLFDLFAKIKLDTSEYEEGIEKSSGLLSKFGDGIKTVAKISAVGITAGVAAVTALTKQSVAAYGEYEQLVGGVETLFGTSKDEFVKNAVEAGMSVRTALEEYATFEQGSDIVMRNAANAFKTAGLSANEYMQTVTSFSASLLQSLDGDTVKAANAADMALRDMSDNANKMGTDMSSIQAAYQGFAKGQYQLLDNLKLGYGGTRGEMERLLADAEKISGVKYDISSLSDVYDAIHVVQTEMGITGTTAKEAATTIQGSTATMKAAWQNLVTGMGDSNADLSRLITDVVDSAKTVFKNVMPVAKQAIQGVSTLIKEVAPIIADELPGLVSDILPDLLSAATELINALSAALPSIMAVLIEQAPTIINSIVSALIEQLPQIIELGLQVIVSLANGIAQSLPDLIPTIVDVVIQIVDTLIDNVDMLVDSAIAIILALANGLITALPKLIEKAPVIIEKLVLALIENAPKLLAAAAQAIFTLVQGIGENLPKIFESGGKIVGEIVAGVVALIGNVLNVGKQIINKVWDGIKSLNPLEWGKDLISNFVKGITSGISKVADAAKGIADKVRSFLHFSEPDEGPLSDFHTYAPDMIDLWIDGIRKNEKRLQDQIAKTFDFEPIITAGYDTSALDGLSVGSYNEPIVTVTTTTTDTDNRGMAAMYEVLVQYLPYLPEIIDAMKNLKIYMDGTQVGGVVDEHLGQIVAKKVRAM